MDNGKFKIEPFYIDAMVTFYRGDCIEVMQGLEANSVDAVVTDPPYGWRFMGKAWDGADIEKRIKGSKTTVSRVSSDGITRKSREKPAEAAGSYDTSIKGNAAFQLWTEQWAREAFRVLKPGGHMLVFCGPRTYHRMASGVEDAGFEIRDQLQWLFGSGFPKSLDVSKAIDKMAGAERPDAIKGGHMAAAGRSHGLEAINAGGLIIENSIPSVIGKGVLTRGTPSTVDAKAWDGWGTALKPAHEPIVLARKPLEKGRNVAQNVLEHGTGAINIDACRVPANGDNLSGGMASNGQPKVSEGWDRPWMHDPIVGEQKKAESIEKVAFAEQNGRFPANVIHDGSDEVLAAFDAFGEKSSGTLHSPRNVSGFGGGLGGGKTVANYEANTGSAARFFYTAKASKSDREAGLREAGLRDGGVGALRDGGRQNTTPRTNVHPTVKPTELMRYLCRLITPPGGTILDPFLGSGSTAKAAVIEQFRCVGIEIDPEYLEIAKHRLDGNLGPLLRAANNE